MARKNYNVDEVLKSLSRKKDIMIDKKHRIIYMLRNKIWDIKSGEIIHNPLRINDIGNGSWGKIDFLHSLYLYPIIKVLDFKEVIKSLKHA